jgi:anaerobic C4-dicarboxylate transporter
MTVSIVREFIVVLAAIWMRRPSGLGLGLGGAAGLLVLVVLFGIARTSPPIDAV